jgi:hypothetical protein
MLTLNTVFEEIQNVIYWLNSQWKQIDEYRKGIAFVIFRELHRDYSKDAAIESMGHRYQDAYVASVRNRRMVLTTPGSETTIKAKRTPLRRDLDSRLNTVLTEQGEECIELDPPSELRAPPKESFLKNILSQLKETSQRVDVPKLEEKMCLSEHARLTKIVQEQKKLVEMMDKEIAVLARLWNKRILFYAALQRLSDDVALPEDLAGKPEAVEAEVEASFVLEGTLRSRLEIEMSSQRYLCNLVHDVEQNVQPESGNCSGEMQHCLICHTSFAEVETISVLKCGVSCFEIFFLPFVFGL